MPQSPRAHRGAPTRLIALVLLSGIFAFACATGDGPTAPDDPATTAAGGTVGSNVVILDGSHIDIEKATNGEDADEPIGPQVPVGEEVVWTYVVTNNGSLPVLGIVVTDDQIGTIDCPFTTLAPGHTMTCTVEGVAEEGQYRNVGTATGSGPTGQQATDEDPSHYFGVVADTAAIDIEKATNGEDADEETGPEIVVGDPIEWSYVVTNTGDLPLADIAVTDDQIGDITCPASDLEPGASMTCTAGGVAVEGQYVNIGSVTGAAADGQVAEDSDPSHYLGVAFVPTPEIDIEKATNGVDADEPAGPVVNVGDPVEWTYEVTNAGNVDLTAVAVTDDQIGAIVCPQATLLVGESMVCSANGIALEGQYANVGTAVGTAPDGTVVEDLDPSHYFGIVPGPGVLSCGVGYWKTHPAAWAATPYSPSDLIGGIFTSTAAYPSIANSTLIGGLSFLGGPGVEGAILIVMRHAIAALLNASHPELGSEHSAAEIIAAVNAAIDSGDRDTILALNESFFEDNDTCPFE